MSSDPLAAARPFGTLVLVVGPSGAGKDTLITLARGMLGSRDDVVFVRRIVTRPSSRWEDHETLDEEAFAAVVKAGRFALHWRAHGLSYALPGHIADDLAAGRTVVANISRSAIDEARARFPSVIAVMITAPPEVLAARLAGRKREAIGESRRPQPVAFVPARVDVTIDNSTSPEAAAAELVKVIVAGLPR